MKIKPTLHHDVDQSGLHNFEVYEMADLSADCKFVAFHADLFNYVESSSGLLDFFCPTLAESAG
jgi:hypothetical protein